MFKRGTMVFAHAETPLHPGAGQGLGNIDLPVQREVFTDLPQQQASGFKGGLRAWLGRPGTTATQAQLDEAFGTDTKATAVHSGATRFDDLGILLFPVRSLKGTYALLTCPLVLNRLERQLCLVNPQPNPPFTLGSIPDPQGGALVPDGGVSLLPVTALGQTTSVVFDEYALPVTDSADATAIALFLAANVYPDPQARPEYRYFVDNLPKRLAIVPDDVFRDFCRSNTQVITRNSIDEKFGTASDTALWSEEHLPAETVLWSLVGFYDPFKPPPSRVLANAKEVETLLRRADGQRVLLGGDRGVGRGLVLARFLGAQP